MVLGIIHVQYSNLGRFRLALQILSVCLLSVLAANSIRLFLSCGKRQDK